MSARVSPFDLLRARSRLAPHAVRVRRPTRCGPLAGSRPNSVPGPAVPWSPPRRRPRCPCLAAGPATDSLPSPFPASWEMCSRNSLSSARGFRQQFQRFFDFFTISTEKSKLCTENAHFINRLSTSRGHKRPSAVDVSADEEPRCKRWHHISEPLPLQN